MVDDRRQDTKALMADAYRALKATRSKLERLQERRRAPLAIIGLGCRFPGDVRSPDDLWRLLSEKRDAIGPIPPERWDAHRFYDPDPDQPGRMTTRSGGFLRGHDEFDPRFFGISPREATLMDPQQRVLLEVTWEALENACIAPDRLRGSATGVWIGLGAMDYPMHLIEHLPRTQIVPTSGTGGSHAVAAGRISYVLGLTGPAIALDTACSSSLVALHDAAQSLRRGECELALAGAINMILSPYPMISLSQARMLSPDGRCKSFDGAADGYGRSEGCGVVVLKRLDDALRDGDRVRAVLCGSAVNQDGASGGLTMPHGPAQEAVIRRALADARLTPAAVDCVEAHGTGTPLGDPIEMRALGQVFGPHRAADSPLWVGSVKANLGHMEQTAGMGGLFKMVLQLEHGMIGAQLHFLQPSPHIPWDDLPVRIPTEAEAWPERPAGRVGGVSSFGFSGTNAHVLLREAPAVTRPADVAHEAVVIPLSARTEDGRLRLAESWATWLAEHPEARVADVAWSAGVGRSAFRYRLAVVASDTASAVRALRAFVAEGSDERLHVGTAEPGEPRGAANPGSAVELAQAWVRGHDVDWRAIGAGRDARPIALPTYPFERQRYWVNRSAAGTLTGSEAERSHPLLGQPSGAAVHDELVFAAVLNADTPGYLAGHRSGRHAVVPAAAWLEMGFAAVTRSLRSSAVALADVALRRDPVILTDDVAVQTIVRRARGGATAFEILLRRGEGPWVTVATGRGQTPPRLPESPASLDKLGARFTVPLDLDRAFAERRATGLDEGPDYRLLRRVRVRPGELLGEAHLTPVQEQDGGEYRVHPLLLQAAVQVAELLAHHASEDRLWTPIAVARATRRRDAGSTITVHASLRERTADAVLVDAVVYDVEGHVVAELDGVRLSARSIDAVADRRARAIGWLHRLDWEPASPAAALPDEGAWAIVSVGSGDAAGRLARAAAERGRAVVRVAGAEALAAALVASPCSRVVGLIGLDGRDDRDAEAVAALCAEVAAIVRTLANRDVALPLVLAVRSAHAVHVDAAPVSPGAGAIWSLGRVIALEHPELACVRIDVDSEGMDGLLDELAADGAEDEVALRDGRRFVARIHRVRYGPLDLDGGLGGGPSIPGARALPDCVAGPATPLDPDQVRVAVRTMAFAGRDLAQAVAQGDEARPMAAVAGEVLAVGAAVTGVEPGDRIVAAAPLRCAPLFSVAMTGVVPIEAGITFESAAEAAYAWAPASLALAALGEPGPSRILVVETRHGLGVAVAELARRAGAEVIVGADSSEARAALRLRGFAHVIDGRNATAVDPWLEQDARVDAAIVSGDRVAHVLPCLRPGGTLVQIADRTLWSPALVASHRPDVVYHVAAVDAAGMPAGVWRDAVSSLLRRASSDELPMLSARVRTFSDLTERRAAGAPLCVVTFDASPSPRSTGTYLVTGGLGALGRHLARWLARRGARHVTVLGRTATDEAARSLRDELAELGAELEVRALDVADRTAVLESVYAIAASQPIRGVFHVAGVLDDGVLDDLTTERFRRVLAPKVAGVRNLDDATREEPLDFFVTYSSSAAWLGSPGQANYAAANGYLDAFARQRRARGRPALSIGWGPWSGAGMAARLDARQSERWRATGQTPLSAEDGDAALDALVGLTATDVAVLPIAWERFGASLPSTVTIPRLASLFGPRESGATEATGELRGSLRVAPPEKRAALLESWLARGLARILRLAVPAVDPHDRFADLGLDSLMGVELRNRVQAELVLTMPMAKLLSARDVHELTAVLLEQLDATDPDAAGAAATEALLAELEAMSDEDAERRLTEDDA